MEVWQDIANVLSWVAVECDALEIVKYLMEEQGCVPPIKMPCMLNSFHLCNFYYLTIEQTLECGIVWLKVAIHNKNLELVKMLIEFEEEPKTSAKKMWKRRNRIKVEKFLVDVAIECAARDIVKYLGRTWTI